MAIANEISKLQPGIDLQFVSYSTGAAALKAHDRPVIDLEMPDPSPLWETVVRAGQVIAETKPSLVISHEEFSAVPVAKIFGLPVVFLTDWFADPEDLRMQALLYADEIIFIEEEGIFDEPPYVEGRVYYAGPVLRRFEYGRGDRERARGELGLPQDAVVILVAPGGRATEEREPIAGLVMSAFDALKCPEKRLVWLAGTDCDALREQFWRRRDVLVKPFDWQVDRLMAASDIGITKGNRITTRELAALGIPSISISQGRNPPDEIVIANLPTNVALDSRTTTPRALAAAMLDALEESRAERPDGTAGPPFCPGARRVAERICEIVQAPVPISA